MKRITAFFIPFFTAVIALIHIGGGALQAKELHAVTMEYPPYEYMEEGKARGIVVDIVTEALRRRGHTLQISFRPWKRALVEVKQGKFDFIFNALFTQERTEYLDFVDVSVFDEEVVLIARKDSNIAFSGNISDITSSSIATAFGSSIGYIFDRAFEEGRLVRSESATIEGALKLLSLGRADLAATDKWTSLYIIANNPLLKNIEVLDPPIEITPTYIAFSKKLGFTKLQGELATTLQEMRADGSIDKIIARYWDRLPLVAK